MVTSLGDGWGGVLLILFRQSGGTVPGSVSSKQPIIFPLTTGVAKEEPSYPDKRKGSWNAQQFGPEAGIFSTPTETYVFE